MKSHMCKQIRLVPCSMKPTDLWKKVEDIGKDGKIVTQPVSQNDHTKGQTHVL